MKYIITGGAGFIGHNVVRQLEALGHECHVIDSLTNYGFVPKPEMEYLTAERQKRFNSIVHEIDIREYTAVKAAFERAGKIDGVIHLASFPRQKVVGQNPVWGGEVMCPALINLLELTKQNNIPKFVYISSSMVYGNFDNDVTEESVCNPLGHYGIMKYMGEKLVEDYTRRGCFDHVIIRPSAVYGEWDVEDRVVSKFMLGAMSNSVLKINGPGEVLDFTYVEDTAQGIVLAAIKPAANNKIFNITRSDTRLYTLKDAAEIAIRIAGSGSVELRGKDADFPSRGRLDISRAILELGYKPTVGVEEGFHRYYNWFKSSTFWQNKLNG
jgi:nucleoside-diphosphate-sugar epimerase